MEEKNYYPFGLEHKGYNNTVISEHPYGFNGKELDESLSLNVIEMDWRQYNPAIGRFNVVDTFAEFMYNHTPYHFSYSDPISFSDPTGLCPNDDCDEDAINEDDPIELDTVVLNVPSEKTNNSSGISFSGRMPHFLRYGEQPVTWDSPYEPGTLDQYNKDWGTNYTDDNSWNQWYYENHWKPQFDDQRRSIHNATAEMAEFLMYFIPISGGAGDVALNLPKLMRGAKTANAIAKTITTKFSIRANHVLNLEKQLLMDGVNVKMSYSTIRRFQRPIRFLDNVYKYKYDFMNTETVYKTTNFILKYGSKLYK
ncbi:RHS repeat domain-containing protein [Psychroflexus sp. MES1-P1E]|uniref:RHS repeat domain-containing protein n=1 Tax=Psychroflexus sp. MES1-P1E TaxID=2058320 RepID=UPI0021557302|nr:RHS repeat-associated core domain-containing protein [Psychroflexus sp. MES1-P1E]